MGGVESPGVMLATCLPLPFSPFDETLRRRPNYYNCAGSRNIVVGVPQLLPIAFANVMCAVSRRLGFGHIARCATPKSAASCCPEVSPPCSLRVRVVAVPCGLATSAPPSGALPVCPPCLCVLVPPCLVPPSGGITRYYNANGNTFIETQQIDH